LNLGKNDDIKLKMGVAGGLRHVAALKWLKILPCGTEINNLRKLFDLTFVYCYKDSLDLMLCNIATPNAKNEVMGLT